MARYTGPDCKLCRREKTKLFLKGAKCDSPKCPIEIRPYPPGEHGRNRPKGGGYLQQSREKQKASRVYRILERQVHGSWSPPPRCTPVSDRPPSGPRATPRPSKSLRASFIKDSGVFEVPPLRGLGFRRPRAGGLGGDGFPPGSGGSRGVVPPGQY